MTRRPRPKSRDYVQAAGSPALRAADAALDRSGAIILDLVTADAAWVDELLRQGRAMNRLSARIRGLEARRRRRLAR